VRRVLCGKRCVRVFEVVRGKEIEMLEVKDGEGEGQLQRHTSQFRPIFLSLFLVPLMFLKRIRVRR
jgi:hypothetical protein